MITRSSSLTRPVALDRRQRHLRLEHRVVLLACPLHVLLPRSLRFLGAGLHLSQLSHFRGPSHTARPIERKLSDEPSSNRLDTILADPNSDCHQPHDFALPLPMPLVKAERGASSSRSIFAAVGARQPTSRARVLEVRIQAPPAVSLRIMRFPRAAPTPCSSTRT